MLLTILLQAQQQQPKSMWSSLIWIVALILIFWLFFIRPQSKRAKDAQKFRDELKKGDPVVTIGGFHGKITEVKEHTVMVSVAPDTVVEIEKSALVQNASQVGGQN
jgi:preprotein translocase subunit YajC